MLKDIIVFFAREWRLSEGEDVEDDTHTEEIAYRFILRLSVFQINHFRCDVAWSSTSYKHKIFLGILSQSKVSNNAVEVSFMPHQNVFRLQIPMHNVMLMHNLQAFKDTFHDHFDLSLSEFVLSLDFVVELSSFEQLNADIDGVLALINLIEAHKIFVVELPHNFYFFHE